MTPFDLVGQALAGWLIADFFSGFFHWWEDRVGNLDTPLIGRFIVQPNRYHHVEPIRPITWVADGIVWPIAFAIAALWWWLLGPSVALLTALLGGLIVNSTHAWAHQPAKAAWPVRMLQETGLLQSGPHHAGHHRGAHDRRYCILTNWLNPFLDQMQFWAGLEWSLGIVGLEPNRGTR